MRERIKSKFLKKENHTSFFLRLPQEIQLMVLAYLSPTELINIGLVNRELNELSKENTLWRSHCEQSTLQNASAIFRNQFKLETLQKIPNPSFFFPSQCDHQTLTCHCVLVGDTLRNQSQILKLYNVESASEFLKYIYVSDISMAKYNHTFRNKLILFFQTTSEYLRTLPVTLKKAHCIFLLVNLEEADFMKADNDLNKIRMTQTKAYITVLGTYTNEQNKQISDAALRQFALNENIKFGHTINLTKQDEIKCALNTTIKTLVAEHAEMEFHAKTEAPKEERPSKCLMM